MSLVSSIALIMIAGLMNGSYAFPIKYMKHWEDENIWLVFSPIAFLLMPWICLYLMDHHFFDLLIRIPHSIILVLALGGFLFGIGMIVFTYSLRFVGLGVSFMLNISSSTVIATLLPIIWMEPKKLFSWFGFAEIAALFFFCIAIVMSYLASLHKSCKTVIGNRTVLKSHALYGVLLGIFSGVLTSAQGFSYAYATASIKKIIINFSDMILMTIPWIMIFSAAFIPYFFYFLFKGVKNKSLINIVSKGYLNYYTLCVIMGMLYFGSLVIFSRASSSFGQMGVVVAWPMLMIFIILTSNIWSFVQKEWNGAKPIAFGYLLVSVLALIAAVVCLGWAGYLNIF
jgi:L-rhamnose-H+ transport protein